MSKELEALWNDALCTIKERVNPLTFKTWFENITPVARQEDTIIISAPSSFAKEWVESRYLSLIKDVLSETTGARVSVKFAVATPVVPLDEPEKVSSVKEIKVSPLKPNYTFENFVIGASNRFAHAAALAVAEKPSQAYNPLFIYGGVGLGKTHLLQAIAYYINTHYSHLRIKYISTEQFTNEFIESIQHRDKIAGFYKKYRNKDVLLVDDIQFLEGKEATQQEFFHTFNTLYEANKQIVISSDRPPKDISTLEDRLKSRFEWGLITDIQPPDIETRIAILKNKTKIQGVYVPDEVMALIASKIKSNIRELEGALTRVIAFSSLTGSFIEVSLAEEVLKDVYSTEENRPVSPQLIQSEVCRYFNILKSDLVSSKRSHSIAYPRQIAMYITREITDLSLPKIGEIFGGRDHTTVLHAVNKIESLILKEKNLYSQLQELVARIKQKR